MGRPPTIGVEQILEAAREIFLKKGINATTEEVAQKAGISTASIFKRFLTKKALFVAAMQAERDRQDWLGLLKRRSVEIGLQEAMVELGIKVVTFYEKLLPMALLSWSNLSEHKAMSHQFQPRPIEQLVDFLTEEMAAGRLRQQEPWLVARAFMGTLQGYVLMKAVLRVSHGPKYDRDAYVRGMVGVLWAGIGPANQPPAAP